MHLLAWRRRPATLAFTQCCVALGQEWWCQKFAVIMTALRRSAGDGTAYPALCMPTFIVVRVHSPCFFTHLQETMATRPGAYRHNTGV